jgi:hypothetical protein
VIRKLTPNLPERDPNSGGSGNSKVHSLVSHAFALSGLGALVHEGD